VSSRLALILPPASRNLGLSVKVPSVIAYQLAGLRRRLLPPAPIWCCQRCQHLPRGL